MLALLHRRRLARVKRRDPTRLAAVRFEEVPQQTLELVGVGTARSRSAISGKVFWSHLGGHAERAHARGVLAVHRVELSRRVGVARRHPKRVGPVVIRVASERPLRPPEPLREADAAVPHVVASFCT